MVGLRLRFWSLGVEGLVQQIPQQMLVTVVAVQEVLYIIHHILSLHLRLQLLLGMVVLVPMQVIGVLAQIHLSDY
jgi:hypothetical protein